jgi:predicted RNase H-like HicB family nuclease
MIVFLTNYGGAMIVDVYLQVKRTGRTHAHVPDLPGCNWLADTPEAAWNRSEASILAHLAWLKKYSLTKLPEDEQIIPRLAQQHKSCAREGNLIGFFESERQPVANEEIPHFLELMKCARLELLELACDLRGEILDWKPAPDSWSVEETLRHVAGAERWYLTRILKPDSIPHFNPCKIVWQRLEIVRSAARERLSTLSVEERGTVTADEAGELWTARKVFRRYVEHEREHTAHIQEILEQYRSSH